MADDKELFKKLFKIAVNQQKIITKMAQMVKTPESADKDVANSILAKLTAKYPNAAYYKVGEVEKGAERCRVVMSQWLPDYKKDAAMLGEFKGAVAAHVSVEAANVSVVDATKTVVLA